MRTNSNNISSCYPLNAYMRQLSPLDHTLADLPMALHDHGWRSNTGDVEVCARQQTLVD